MGAHLKEDLERDLAAGESLVHHYQPVLSTDTREHLGVEALIRWNHPKEGTLEAERVVPLAESTGLIQALDMQSFRIAMRQAASWTHRGVPFGSIFINVSSYSVFSAAFRETVQQRLDAYPELPPSRVVLEISEQAALRYVEQGGDLAGLFGPVTIAVALEAGRLDHSLLFALRDLSSGFLKVPVASFRQSNEEGVPIRGIGALDLGLGVGLDVEIIAECRNRLRSRSNFYLPGADFGNAGSPVLQSRFIVPDRAAPLRLILPDSQ